MRTGFLAKKVGMTRIFNGDGISVPVTVLMLDRCRVLAHKVIEKHGYNALLVGGGTSKQSSVSKPQRVQWAFIGYGVPAYVSEFRVTEDAYVDIGSEFCVSHFVQGQFVDVSSFSVGKGFAGAMKRHNFSGLRASHGVSVSHRSHGSTGQRQDPGRVFKGKKMAGQMGGVRVTAQNLRVEMLDKLKGLIYLRGAVPGARDSVVEIRDSIKKVSPSAPPHPAGLVVPEVGAVSGDSTEGIADNE